MSTLSVSQMTRPNQARRLSAPAVPIHPLDRMIYALGIPTIDTQQVRSEQKTILSEESRKLGLPRWHTARLNRAMTSLLTVVLLTAMGLWIVSAVAMVLSFIGVVPLPWVLMALIMGGATLGIFLGLVCAGYFLSTEVPYWQLMSLGEYRNTGMCIPIELWLTAEELQMRLPGSHIEVERLVYTKDPYIRISLQGKTVYFGRWEAENLNRMS